MALVKKTIELDQEQINRIKIALKAKSEKEAINTVLKQFDTDIQLAEVILADAGSYDFEIDFNFRDVT
jgi:restriction endonuclease S subunit